MLKPLTIVESGGFYGVVTGRKLDRPLALDRALTLMYRVQFVYREDDDFGAHIWKKATQVRHLAETQLAVVGFCENDHLQALILCAAAGTPFKSGDSYTDGVV